MHVYGKPELRAELGTDKGVAAGRRYGARMAEGFRAVRASLDAFNPDFVLLFGDDQYENFREDIIPAFCVMGLDNEFTLQPWAGGRVNRWDEPEDWTLKLQGQRDVAKFLARALIDRGIDTAYAYKTLHEDGLAHAFTNTLLYLDWDRKGFPWPVLPFAINCYGTNLIHAKGGLAALFKPPQTDAPDPPGPQPWRCMDVGKAIAEILLDSPYRVALVASSSWSHCFLSPTNGYLWPDTAADRQMFDALARSDHAVWRGRSRTQMEAAGQHELLLWMALLGAMEATGQKPVIHDWVETHLFMSNKAFVTYPAAAR